MPNVGFVVGLRDDWNLFQELKKKPLPNVQLSSFVPQKELLNDKRIKAFITHGGIGSILEAIYYATPIIACPIYSDQFPNGIRIEQLGIGFLIMKANKVETMISYVSQLLEDQKENKMRNALKRMQ